MNRFLVSFSSPNSHLSHTLHTNQCSNTNTPPCPSLTCGHVRSALCRAYSPSSFHPPVQSCGLLHFLQVDPKKPVRTQWHLPHALLPHTLTPSSSPSPSHPHPPTLTPSTSWSWHLPHTLLSDTLHPHTLLPHTLALQHSLSTRQHSHPPPSHLLHRFFIFSLTLTSSNIHHIHYHTPTHTATIHPSFYTHPSFCAHTHSH